MEEALKNAIEEYQCSGCMKGHNIECYGKDNGGSGCGEHYAGTGIMGAMGHIKIFLGMPKGFNRLGDNKDLRPRIFENHKQLVTDWEYDKFNQPVWKYLSKDGHTFIRGISPRINAPFIHVVLEDCIGEINCLEISQEELDAMD